MRRRVGGRGFGGIRTRARFALAILARSGCSWRLPDVVTKGLCSRLVFAFFRYHCSMLERTISCKLSGRLLVGTKILNTNF